MKTIKLLLVGGLVAGATTLALAGPGTDYWLSRQKLQRERASAKDTVPAQTCCTPACGCGETRK